MDFLIPIIVGAIIGYITNWLAIKMLFRPYEKKYFLNIPIPFTPGLIPKEQRRIAKSVGDAVGDYLLTEDVIMENIQKGKLEDKFEEYFKKEIGRLEENELTIGDLLEKINFIGYEEIKNRLGEDILALIIKNLKDNKNTYLEFINSYIDKLDYDKNIGKISTRLKDEINEFSQSDKLKELLENKIEELIEVYKVDSRKLGEIIDDDKVNSFIDNNSHYLVGLIRNALNDYSVELKVKEILNNIINKNVSKAILLFTGSDMITEKVYSLGREYLYNEEFNESIKPILKTSLESIVDKEISELVVFLENKLDRTRKDILIESIRSSLFNEDNQKEIINIIENKFYENKDNMIGSLKKALDGVYDGILSSEKTREILSDKILNFIERLAEVKISKFIGRIDNQNREILVAKIKDILIKLINTRLPRLLANFDISKIVEEEINNFEVDFAEEIILEIASKELKAITWLGALLGGVMGLLTPLIQML